MSPSSLIPCSPSIEVPAVWYTFALKYPPLGLASNTNEYRGSLSLFRLLTSALVIPSSFRCAQAPLCIRISLFICRMVASAMRTTVALLFKILSLVSLTQKQNGSTSASLQVRASDIGLNRDALFKFWSQLWYPGYPGFPGKWSRCSSVRWTS